MANVHCLIFPFNDSIELNLSPIPIEVLYITPCGMENAAHPYPITFTQVS